MAYYNFLPPFDQVYPDLPASGNNTIPVPTGIGNINRLDAYLPSYNLTTGELVELQVGPTGIALNLQGTPGPTGPGLNGNPPPATPFMMVAYGQTSRGLVQFTLVKGSTSFVPNTVPDIDKIYLLAPINDTLDYSRVVQLYYTIDTSQNGINGAPGGSANAVRFFDAEKVRQNPGSSAYNYELAGFAKSFKNDDSFASWPNTTNYDSDYSINLYFYFNELVAKTNINQERLFSGQFYHPYFVALSALGGSVPSDFITYNTDNYYSGYGPGYPISINYEYAPITQQILPTIENGVDNVSQTYLNYPNSNQTFVATWPGPVSLNVYNFPVNDLTNVIVDSLDFSTNSFVIDEVCNNSFLPCDCNNNNFCAGNKTNSYNTANQNTIQAGIANYLIYQFIPFTQLKTPSGFIVTDPQNSGNTGYTYVTLPNDGVNQFEPTPVGVSGTTFYGSYAIQSQNMLDTTIGPTGLMTSNTSIISGWYQNPLNLNYQCEREVASDSLCGFTDYYDSLFGVAYNYGTCGTTGLNEDPYQKGACPTGELCVPNFVFLQQYDSTTTPPFICVSGSTGVSYANLNEYASALPPSNIFNSRPILPQYGVQKLTPAKEKEATTDNVWLYIGIILAVIILVIVIFLIARGFSNKSNPSYPRYNPVVFT